MTNSEKRQLVRKIQAAMDYSGIKGTVDGLSRRGKLPRFLVTCPDKGGLSVWPCIAQFFGSWSGFEVTLNGELWIHCARCNWPHLASGFNEDGICSDCSGPRKYYKPDPIKQRARGITNRAIKNGLVRGEPDACEDCGRTDENLTVHHKDYSDPLDIEWLCTTCHGRRHRGWRKYYSFRSPAEARMAWIE